jgi:alkanesulfonate monooxygenase SsuD/methylene tetrahydromethanopterin reductase-like flavin-dependent oxidoreductase (luciferase family)
MLRADGATTIRLGCCVANFVTRRPCVVASAIAAIQVASGGCALCAVGKGDSALGRIGLGSQRHADLAREIAPALRSFSAG